MEIKIICLNVILIGNSIDFRKKKNARILVSDFGAVLLATQWSIREDSLLVEENTRPNFYFLFSCSLGIHLDILEMLTLSKWIL